MSAGGIREIDGPNVALAQAGVVAACATKASQPYYAIFWQMNPNKALNLFYIPGTKNTKPVVVHAGDRIDAAVEAPDVSGKAGKWALVVSVNGTGLPQDQNREHVMYVAWPAGMTHGTTAEVITEWIDTTVSPWPLLPWWHYSGGLADPGIVRYTNTGMAVVGAGTDAIPLTEHPIDLSPEAPKAGTPDAIFTGPAWDQYPVQPGYAPYKDSFDTFWGGSTRP